MFLVNTTNVATVDKCTFDCRVSEVCGCGNEVLDEEMRCSFVRK